MNTLRLSLVAFAALAASALGLGGCAADSGESTEETPVVAKTEEGEVETTQYTARIMKADIVAGGGRCAGNLCTINGRMYDCSGAGYCTEIKMQ